MTTQWLDRWEELLARGRDPVAEALTTRSPEAIELRQNTPFTGVLTQSERAAVLDAFNRHWRDQHSYGATTSQSWAAWTGPQARLAQARSATGSLSRSQDVVRNDLTNGRTRSGHGHRAGAGPPSGG
jgi:hypothetical protein